MAVPIDTDVCGYLLTMVSHAMLWSGVEDMGMQNL